MHQIIHIHADAPLKPAFGASCNGCGVCCLAEPCPLGALLSGRTTGACRVLAWDETASCYRCGALGGEATDRAASERGFGAWRTRVVARFIGAGQGCDSDALAEPA